MLNKICQSLLRKIALLYGGSLLVAGGYAQNFCTSVSDGGMDPAEWALDVEADARGNVYYCGGYRNGAEIGGVNYPGMGQRDVFVAKYNGDGAIQWVQRMGGSGPDHAEDIEVGADGFIYVSGVVRQGAVPADRISLHNWDAFFARYDTSGNLQWMKEIQGDVFSEGYGITQRAPGLVFGTGLFETLAYFDTDTLVSAGGKDVFVAAWDENGNELWCRSFGSALQDLSPAITADVYGNVYLTGTFTGQMVADADTFNTAPGRYTAYVISLSSSGQIKNVFTLEGGTILRTKGISADAGTSIYLTGEFSDTLFTAPQMNSSGFLDGFVIKLDTALVPGWRVQAEGPADQKITGISAGKANEVCLSGYCFGEVVVSGITATGSQNDNFYLFRLDENGTLIELYLHDAPGQQVVNGIYHSPAAVKYLAGYYADTLILGNDSLTSVNATQDMFWTRIGDAPLVLMDSIAPIPHCAGDSFNLFYTATGCFPAGNRIEVQVSDAAGNFASPQILASEIAAQSGSFSLVVPPGIAQGNGYRFRLHVPALLFTTADNGFDIPIGNFILNPFAIAGDTVICPGDTLLLDAGNGYAAYSWSGGTTASSLFVTQPGIYSCTVTDFFNCTAADFHQVDSCLLSSLESPSASLSLYPQPARVEFSLQGIRVPGELYIYAADGQLVKRFAVAGENQNFSVAGLAAGFYTLRYQTAAGSSSGKLVILPQ